MNGRTEYVGWAPEELNGYVLFNSTPHQINFELNGEVIEVPQCGVLINAKAVEEVITIEDGIEYIHTIFEEDAESLKALEELEALFPKSIIIGSIIAAQAYPGRVVAMVPMAGAERVHPSEKRMNPFKFTSFEEKEIAHRTGTVQRARSLFNRDFLNDPHLIRWWKALGGTVEELNTILRLTPDTIVGDEEKTVLDVR